MTRELWLEQAVNELRPIYLAKKLEIPPVRVACGFPSKGALTQTPRMGECWSATATNDGTRQIFISPLLADPVKVLGALSHQLLNAALPDDIKYGAKYKEALAEIGLEGKLAVAAPGPDLLALCETLAERLGDYPNAALKPKDAKSKKPANKNTFKLFCPEKRDCTKKCLLLDKAIGEDYTTSAGRKTLRLGMPHCPCGHEMMMEEADFKLYKANEE